MEKAALWSYEHTKSGEPNKSRDCMRIRLEEKGNFYFKTNFLFDNFPHALKDGILSEIEE